jgi:hypothetical protein
LPVWHASIARINNQFSAIVPIEDWSPQLKSAAEQIAIKMLHGIGSHTWQRREIGDYAIHFRRRLTPKEMQLLHAVNSSCPVFTHGAALQAMDEATRLLQG